MSSGEKVRLGDVCELAMGQSPSSNSYNADGEGLPFYQGNADFGEISPIPRVWCTEPKKIAEKNDILISVRAPIGAVNIANEKCCIGRGVAAIRPKKGAVTTAFLKHQLMASQGKLESMGTGSTFKAISKKALLDFKVTLYPESDQKLIENQLDWAVQQIKLANQQIAQLDQLVKSRFVEMFGELLSETNLATAMRLQDCAEIASGITKGRKVSDGADMITVPYMAVSNVKSGYIDYGTVKSIEVTADELERYRLEPNDVLMTEGGDPDKLGRGAVITAPPSNCIHQNHVFRVRLNREIVRPLYLEMYLQSNTARDYFLHCAKRTTGIATINKRQISNLPVVTPTSEQQDEFIAFAARVDKTRAIAQQQVDKLQTLYDSLVQDYFA